MPLLSPVAIQPLDQIFTQWSAVVNPSWILVLFAATTLHTLFFTFIENWL